MCFRTSLGKSNCTPGKAWETIANNTFCADSNMRGADLGLFLLWVVEKELMKYLDRPIAMTYLTILLSVLDFPFIVKIWEFFKAGVLTQPSLEPDSLWLWKNTEMWDENPHFWDFCLCSLYQPVTLHPPVLRYAPACTNSSTQWGRTWTNVAPPVCSGCRMC